MSELFLKLFNMSLTASWLIGAVILLRFVFKKAPKWILCLLWALVAVRLILPFSFESRVSLVPSAEVLPQSSILSHTPSVDTGIPAVNEAINPVITETLSPDPGDSANPLQVLLAVGSTVWIAGVCIMLLYSLISWLRIQKRVQVRLRLRENIYFSDRIDTPFILGIIKPKIYIPSSLPREQLPLIIAHEQAHLKRLDHLWKPLGFALLAVYWFNPFVWVAYILLCRDIEQACDEKVIKNMDIDARADYSEALLECSIHRSAILACPLAFGEVGVKDRIKAVLNYRKPAFWFLCVTVAVSIIAAICFLTNPWKNSLNLASVQKATEARHVFVSAFGKDAFCRFSSDYIIDCYIDDDYKLHILLNESAKAAEPALNALLKDYRSIVKYEYTPLTEESLQAAQAVSAALTAQGYTVTKASSVFSYMRIVITMDDPEAIISAAKWVKEKEVYPFNLPHTSIRFVLNDGKERDYPEYSEFIDYTQENFYKSEAAAEALLAFLKEQGGYNVYKDYYQGYHIGSDNLLHIYLKVSGAEKEHEKLKTSLEDWANVIVYEYGGYPEEDVWQYHNDLTAALTELGLAYTGGGIHGNGYLHGSGHSHVYMIYRDIPVAMSLLDKKNPYPFGSTELQTIFETMYPIRIMEEEMPPAEVEPVQPEPEEKKDHISFIRSNYHHDIYKDPLDSVTAVIENLVGISGGLSAKVVSITYDPEATQERIDSILKNGLKAHSREYMEENFRVYRVVFDLETIKNYPVKPLANGRYSRKLQMIREDPWPEYWQLYMAYGPEYLGETPAETVPPEPTSPADSPDLPPIVIHHSMLQYTSGATAEETARSAVENLVNTVQITRVEYSAQLTQLNLLLPVDKHRLTAYRYTPEFMEKYFKVINVSCTVDGREQLYTLKTVQDPETGIWEVWDIYVQLVK